MGFIQLERIDKQNIPVFISQSISKLIMEFGARLRVRKA